MLKKKQPPQPFLPSDKRLYCIGDIHGQVDLLKQLLAKIEDDYHAYQGQVILVYLGDYIDRGESSKEVISTLLVREKKEIDYVYLRGNHEQVMLDSLQDETAIASWLTYGGLATLVSYGAGISKIPTKPQDLLHIQEKLHKNIPQKHINFLQQTQLCYSLGNYFFVHAGIYPKKELDKQRAEDLLWIRDEFINSKRVHEKIIVHGHTITDEPQLLGHRIGIDTGAYRSGVLTCLVLESDQQRIIQTNV